MIKIQTCIESSKPERYGTHSVTNPRKFGSHKSISDFGFISAFE